MSHSTRSKLIEKAEVLFAERGFYGASLAQIAQALGLSKQALLHHFGSKEALYGAVLKRLSEPIASMAQAALAEKRPPLQALEELVVVLFTTQLNNPHSANLLMRELLDNEARAQRAGNWYLKPFLDALVTIVQHIDPTLNTGRAIASVYQLLGAAHYFTVSQPTLTQIFGEHDFNEALTHYEDELRTLVQARFRTSRMT